MHRSTTLRMALLLVLLVVPALGEAPEWIGNHRPQLGARALRGKGNWKTAGVRRRPLQRWSLEVVRGADGEVTGTVAVNDSKLLEDGRVRGRIVGDRVSGNVIDANGSEVMRFWGTVKDRKLRGIYTDRTGETGEWAWDGLLPE